MNINSLGHPTIEIFKNTKDPMYTHLNSYAYHGDFYCAVFPLTEKVSLFLDALMGGSGKDKAGTVLNIRKVQVRYDEFQRRVELEEKVGLSKIWENDPDYIPIDWIVSAPEKQEESDLYTVPYEWGTDFTSAESYKDITAIYEEKSYDEILGDYTNKKFYHTSEVIEVLEKWLRLMERWNNPVEREKIIKKYEKTTNHHKG